MRFAFNSIHDDGQVLTRSDVLLRIVGTFFVYVGEKVLYTEMDFPVVEFAVQLAQWIGQLGLNESDFVYTSMDSDIEGLVRITQVESDRWRIESPHQAYDEPRTFSTDEAKRASLEFIHELRAVLRDRLDLLDYLAGERARMAVLGAPS